MQRFLSRYLTISVLELILVAIVAGAVGWLVSETAWSFAVRKAQATNVRPNP